MGYSVEATDVLEWRTILTRIELAHVTLARQTYPRCLVTTVCFPWARLAPPLTVGGGDHLEDILSSLCLLNT